MVHIYIYIYRQKFCQSIDQQTSSKTEKATSFITMICQGGVHVCMYAMYVQYILLCSLLPTNERLCSYLSQYNTCTLHLHHHHFHVRTDYPTTKHSSTLHMTKIAIISWGLIVVCHQSLLFPQTAPYQQEKKWILKRTVPPPIDDAYK